MQVPPGQIGRGRNRGRRLRYDAHMPLGPPSLQIKSPLLWSALLRKSAMHSRAEHLSAASPAPGLLHVLWHMQKLSFACHCCTRSLLVCVQASDLWQSHTCSGFDPPAPNDTGTGARQQLQPLTHSHPWQCRRNLIVQLTGAAFRGCKTRRYWCHLLVAIFSSQSWLPMLCNVPLPWPSSCT